MLQKEAGPGSRSEPVARVRDCMWSPARLDRTSVILNSQEHWTPDLGQHRAAEWGVALGTSPLTAELIHSGSGQTVVLNCVLISKPTKLQDTAPNPWSPRWAWGNTVGHKTKWTDGNVRGICGKQGVRTGMGRGEGKSGQDVLWHLQNCQRTILINKQKRNKFGISLVSLISNVYFGM